MSNNVKEEIAVASPMNELSRWRPAQRKSAENERTRIEGEFLASGRSLLPDQANGFDLLPSPFRETD